MRPRILVTLAASLTLLASFSLAHEGMELPPGPIADRHHLMENIGANAKKVGEALKAGDMKAIPPAAEAIAADARKIPSLFPEGTLDPKSRAKEEIWKDFPRFEKISAELATEADALAKAAASGGDAGAAAKEMFSNCKACHDAFRLPEED